MLNTIVTYGLLTPFRRDQKSDFANGTSADLIKANVRTILGTRCGTETEHGELSWNSKFGSRLFLLRHRKPDVTTRELARIYAIDALARWEPRVSVTGADYIVDGRKRIIPVTFNIIARGGVVVVSDQNVDVTLT